MPRSTAMVDSRHGSRRAALARFFDGAPGMRELLISAVTTASESVRFRRLPRGQKRRAGVQRSFLRTGKTGL